MFGWHLHTLLNTCTHTEQERSHTTKVEVRHVRSIHIYSNLDPFFLQLCGYHWKNVTSNTPVYTPGQPLDVKPAFIDTELKSHLSLNTSVISHTSTLRGQKISQVGGECVVPGWLWMSGIYVEGCDPCSSLQNRWGCLRVRKLWVARLETSSTPTVLQVHGGWSDILGDPQPLRLLWCNQRRCREEGNLLKPEEIWELFSVATGAAA